MRVTRTDGQHQLNQSWPEFRADCACVSVSRRCCGGPELRGEAGRGRRGGAGGAAPGSIHAASHAE